MPILDKIEVRIRSKGEILTEYDDPDEQAAEDTKTVTKFIEATPGVGFSIVVSLMRGYKFHGADYVYVRRRMDGLRCRADLIPKTASGDSVTRAITCEIESEKRFDEKTGQWKKASFSFGQIEIGTRIFWCLRATAGSMLIEHSGAWRAAR